MTMLKVALLWSDDYFFLIFFAENFVKKNKVTTFVTA